jgi:hypothetical protein
MEKITEFIKKNWIWITIAVIVIIAVCIYLKRRKKAESGFDLEQEGACVDCGPGGMFGPGWTMEKFTKQVDELRKRAGELSNGLSGSELEQAIKRAGGLSPYVEGRETAFKRINEATNDLKDVMKIPGVHGIGTIMDEYIEIAVIDEAAKHKVIKFIEIIKKAKPMIPSHGEGYMNYPVKIVIREQAKAQ